MPTMKTAVAASTGAVVLTVISVCVCIYINNVQPSSYMDEVFHVPQAQKYCEHNFTAWDPMITTLPGLYFVSIGLLQPVSAMLALDVSILCTTSWLRAVNVLFMIGNFYLIFCIYRILHPQAEQENPWKLVTMVTALASFPLLYFFTFLYYTDPGSVFFVLNAYLYHLLGNRFPAALMSVVAILFRQTNIVWVVFIAGLSVQEEILKWMKTEKKDLYLNSIESDDAYLIQTFFNLMFSSVRFNKMSVLNLIFKIISSTFWYVCVGLGFILFVYINQGVVVGDRSHHQACFNVPQLFYFFSFTLFFAFPYMVSLIKIFDFREFVPKNFFVTSFSCFLSTVAINQFTYCHEYLLADNRHYTFYIWSRIYRRHVHVKYLLVPVYYFAAFQFYRCLKHRDIFWKLVFTVCLLASTVPQKLMEFRYFIIPYLIFRLNIKPDTWTKVLLELVLYTAVNIVTIYLFTEKPFMWKNSNEIQRFMW